MNRKAQIVKALLPLATRVFCPTGAGGGIDPTCGKDGKGRDEQGLTPSQREALNDYQAGVGADINGIMRSKQEFEHEWQHSLVKEMDSIFAEHGEEINQPLFRMVDIAYAIKVGDVFIDKGYASTTKNKAAIAEMAEVDGAVKDEDYYVMEIRVERGAKGIDMNKLSPGAYFSDQEEVVLERGLEYEVTKKFNGRFQVIARKPK